MSIFKDIAEEGEFNEDIKKQATLVGQGPKKKTGKSRKKAFK
jgi:hypothetical protein